MLHTATKVTDYEKQRDVQTLGELVPEGVSLILTVTHSSGSVAMVFNSLMRQVDSDMGGMQKHACTALWMQVKEPQGGQSESKALHHSVSFVTHCAVSRR